jgi:hypothetical protein
MKVDNPKAKAHPASEQILRSEDIHKRIAILIDTTGHSTEERRLDGVGERNAQILCRNRACCAALPLSHTPSTRPVIEGRRYHREDLREQTHQMKIRILASRGRARIAEHAELLRMSVKIHIQRNLLPNGQSS